MNRWMIAILLLAGSGAFSGCIFGRKTHSTVTAGRTDSTAVAIHNSDTAKFMAPLPGNIAARDTSKTTIKTDTVAGTVKQDSAAVAVKSVNTQKINNGTALLHQPFAYTTFDGKAKMHYEGNGTGQDFTANFRIKKDSIIWVAVNAFGGMLPVARAYITPDSIKVINFLSKEVILMPISQANRLLPAPVDFSILQNLFTGQPLLSNGTVTNVADSAIAWMVYIVDNDYKQQLAYWRGDSTLQNQQMTTTAPNGPMVSVQQKSFLHEDGKPFPRLRTVHVDNNGTLYDLTMDFTSQSFNKQLDFPFSYSSKYAVNPAK